MSKKVLSDVLVEVWDAESDLDVYDQDYDNIDLRITVYKTHQTYADTYKSEQLDIDEFSKAMSKDLESAFGFTEWMTALYALTQYEFPKRIQNFIIYTVAEHENITVAEIEQAVAHEKNEIAKMELTR